MMLIFIINLYAMCNKKQKNNVIDKQSSHIFFEKKS